jgi:hypothetical protein
VPDRIDASVQPMQPTLLDPPVYLTVGQAEIAQLPSLHHSMLSRRKRGDPLIRMATCEFSTYTVENS